MLKTGTVRIAMDAVAARPDLGLRIVPVGITYLARHAFLSDVHPAPNTDAKATATSAGTYTVGPIRFDAAGTWTVRFHVSEECTDVAEDSPHGHAAFFVRVP